MTETDEKYLIDRLNDALERNDQQAFERALKSGEEPSGTGELDWNILQPVLRWGRGWSMGVLFEQVDWSRFDRTREDLVAEAIKNGASNLYERAAKRGCGMAVPIKVALQNEKTDVARLFGTASNVELDTNKRGVLNGLAGVLAPRPDLLGELLKNDHFRHESTKGTTVETNLLSMVLAHAEEHHSAHANAIINAPETLRTEVLQGLLRARPPEWVHQQLCGRDEPYHEGVSGLQARSVYKKGAKQLQDLVKNGADAEAVMRALRDGASSFYPGDLKRAPIRTIIEAYHGDELRSIFRTLCQTTDYPLYAYFSQRYPLVRLALLADERVAFDFFHDRYDRTDADINNMAYSLMRAHKLHWLADLRDTYDEHNFDPLSLTDPRAESALTTVRNHPESYARIMPLIRQESRRRSILYGYARVLSTDNFLPVIKAVKNHGHFDDMKKQYDRSAAGAFLAMRYETVEALLDEKATVSGVLTELLEMENQATTITKRGNRTPVNIIDRHAHMVLTFFEELVGPEHDHHELYALVAEGLIDNGPNEVLVNLFERLRERCDSESDSLDEVYGKIARGSEQYPRFVRFLVDWRKPGPDMASKLADEGYSRILDNELDRPDGTS